MKKAYIYILAIALGALAFSCEFEVEPTPTFEKSDAAVTVASSATTVAVSAADSLKEVVSLSWNDPGYAVGLTDTKFTVRIAESGSNFSSFVSKDFTGVLTGALLGRDLNGAAFKFGGKVGEPIALDVMVVATHSNNNEQKVSNVIQVTVTPYRDVLLTASTTSVVTDANIPDEEAIKFSWNEAFAGLSNVKTYHLQYAEGGTDFGEFTGEKISGFEKSFTQIQLNKIALALGGQAGLPGSLDFRIEATNELGVAIYSNTVSVEVTPYVAFNSIGIIGDATLGDWAFDTDLHRPDPDKPTEWTVTLYLIGGKVAKFRANDDWVDNWGSTGFPSGTGTQNGANIPISASGYYKVDLNVGTGAYTFTPVTISTYTSVSLIGAETDWSSDIADLTVDPGNDQIWSGIVTLQQGEVKFRANHDWAVNWGRYGGEATDLSGYSTQGGPNMQIEEAGQYYAYINTATGEYFFGKIDANTPFLDIGIIGDATPGGWDQDTNLIKSPSNPFRWSGTITLTDGGAKFRANDDWAINWGGDAFPNGMGIQDGPNIPASAGTYFIVFNSATREYTFSK